VGSENWGTPRKTGLVMSFDVAKSLAGGLDAILKTLNCPAV